MKKLLSILTITTLTASVPTPLLANTPLTRYKRNIGTTEKDFTIGFDIKMKETLNNWKKVYYNENFFKNIDNKYYFVVWRGLFNNEWKISKFNNNAEQIKISTISTWLMKNFGDLTIGYGRNWKDWKNNDGTFFKSVYRWDGTGEPQTPQIDSNGNITNWNIDKTPFQQGIVFTIVNGSKTAKWSNNGIRLTVDGETNININNSNVEEVYWDGVLQPQANKKWKINIKPETTAKEHKLVIKYNINGTKYTSEDIAVSMLAKINPPKQFVKKQLNELIKKTDLGNVGDNNDDTIFLAVNKTNGNIIDDFTQLEITKKTNNEATLSVKKDSKSYDGSVDINYNVVPATVVDLKIDLQPTTNTVNIDIDYVGQIDKTIITNKVDPFYYVSSESTLTMLKPTQNSVITGVVYGCDDKWEKNGQQKIIDVNNGIKLDGSQLGAVKGRYLIELKNELEQTNKIYLQINNNKEMKEYWNTDNGKQFEQWAEDNGHDNIRGSNASQLNKLFELSATWKQSLRHLELKLDSFVVDNIKNVTQDEIDNYKTKLLASVKAQVEKYAPNVVENIDYAISVDNLVTGDWTTSKDVKVQAVDGITKLLSFTAKTIPVQQKEQSTPPTPTPDNNKKILTGWAIGGIIVGVLSGLLLLGWLFKKFVITPFILEPIRKKKAKAFATKTEKDIAQMKKDEAEEEAKRKGKK